jgi:hypothetical protein
MKLRATCDCTWLNISDVLLWSHCHGMYVQAKSIRATEAPHYLEMDQEISTVVLYGWTNTWMR